MDAPKHVTDLLGMLDGVGRCAEGWVARCPAHEDKISSLSVGVGDDARILLNCHAGCPTKTILDVLGLDWPALFSAREKSQNSRSPRRKEYCAAATPTDLDISIGLKAHGWALDLAENEEALEYLWQQRGIKFCTAIEWGVGASEIFRSPTGKIGSVTWAFQVLSPTPPYPLVGVKMHRDIRKEGESKGFWVPRGVQASHHLYPPPEAQRLQAGDEVVLVPGELKALAHLSSGIPATSRTIGETANWPAGLAQRFTGLRVVLDPDREDSMAARVFVEKAVEALAGIAASVEICQ